MKNDSSRNTFDANKHFSSVRMQQGRVQVDADWNEECDIITHRVDTETSDVIGLCGGPLHYPAFHIVADVGQLSPEEQKLPENKNPPNGFKPPDFLISAGRYYVDGILCQNELLTSYLNQPDLPAAVGVKDVGLYLVYIDVWQRHLTTLDDPSIREVALGGPDTATRSKTVWQIKHWFAKDVRGNCVTKFAEFDKLVAAGNGKLSARTKKEKASTNPCIVPPGAGYTGLENQLYRVEVHGAGDAFDVTTGGAGTLVTRVPNTDNQVKFSGGSWKVDDAVEVFSSKAGSDPMNGTLAYVTNVDGGSKTLTLDINVSDLALDELRLRAVKATYKWSRNNAFVATSIESINVTDQEITVHDLGPDEVLGFREGQWVEISDDRLELNGLPGQLIQIAKIDRAINLIALASKPTALSTKPGGIDKGLHPKLRGWDGTGAIKFHPSATEDHFLDLESGVQVSFFAGSFKTGDYWTIPARTATADTQSGNIEWPRDASNKPLAQLPFGIKHHYCRLAMLHWDGSTFDVIQDCRNLFPPITELTSLFYVSGENQEVMPDPPALVPLTQPLIVGVAHGKAPVQRAEVRFHVTAGNGQILTNGTPGTFRQIDPQTLVVLTDQNGLASCAWEVDSITQSQQLKATLQAVTDLTDATDRPVHLPVIFTANLSKASQVAYDPTNCATLSAAGVKTVQQAIDELCDAGSCACTVCVSPEAHNSGKLSLQAAIDKLIKAGGGTICLEVGKYVLKEPLKIQNARSIRIIGKGVLSQLSSQLMAIAVSDKSADVHLEAFSIVCDGSKGGSAVLLHSSSGIFLERLQIGNKNIEGSAVGLSGALDSVMIRDNDLGATAGIINITGDVATGLADLRIEGNRFVCQRVAVSLTSVSVYQWVSHLDGNRITGCAEAGFELTGSTVPGFGIEVASNVFHVLGDGIRAGVDGLRVVDNDLIPFKPSSDNKQHGIVLTKGTSDRLEDIQIVGNRITDFGFGITTDEKEKALQLGSVVITRNQIAKANLGLQVIGRVERLNIENNQINGINGSAIGVNSQGGQIVACGNELEIVVGGPGLTIVCREGDCVFSNNQSHHVKPQGKRDVTLIARTLAVASNRVVGRAQMSLESDVNVKKEPLCTVLGNLTGGDILVNGAPLALPWAPLNFQGVV
ncbi:MAG: right-handed parallel beta-helix repeat-containing protein [Pyrinomonadaceae bacterium]|nr:right-handed parallel beta-helix repeat-containing protein [Pyrinomonadaceae bacterium]